MRRATAWPGDGWPDSGRVVVSGLPARGKPPATSAGCYHRQRHCRRFVSDAQHRHLHAPSPAAAAYTRVISRLAAQTDEEETHVQATDIRRPDYFHRVVDCQWACPAHTPVPEYIRLIAAGRYSDAYMVNWHSNVFPGILGRTCDRPCEPACRRGRVEENQAARPEPVAICRLKRVAADFKDDVTRSHAAPAGADERPTRRLHRRRAGVAHRRPRPCPSRIRGHFVRSGSEGGRHDPHADPPLPPARRSDRRGNRLRPRRSASNCAAASTSIR